MDGFLAYRVYLASTRQCRIDKGLADAGVEQEMTFYAVQRYPHPGKIGMGGPGEIRGRVVR